MHVRNVHYGRYSNPGLHYQLDLYSLYRVALSNGLRGWATKVRSLRYFKSLQRFEVIRNQDFLKTVTPLVMVNMVQECLRSLTMLCRDQNLSDYISLKYLLLFLHPILLAHLTVNVLDLLLYVQTIIYYKFLKFVRCELTS